MLMLKMKEVCLSYTDIVETLPDNIRMLYFGGTIYLHVRDLLGKLGVTQPTELEEYFRVYDISLNNATHRGKDLYIPYEYASRLCCYLSVDSKYNVEVAKKVAYSLYHEPQ